ncbi:thioesterase II family protein [Xanthomonas sp. NCPPB 2632]|uniref:thioesterase II family protein n=1 Tax=Xanthomonas sp. NCPPB 2632 TaxID=3240912 RepID=UPI003513BAA8
MSLSPWLVPLRRSARTERRLICLPHAGGSAHTFRSLAAYLPEDIDMWSVQLPGRGSRFNEPPLQSMSEVLHELLPVVEMLLDYPDVPPNLSSAPVSSSIPHKKEIGREEAFFRRADHWLPARGRGRHAGQGPMSQARLQ